MSFNIRVAEEQAVFICNSNFSCQCFCHGRIDEQPHSTGTDGEDDDVARRSDYFSSEVENDNSVSFIEESVEESLLEGEGIGGVVGRMHGQGDQESNEYALMGTVVLDRDQGDRASGDFLMSRQSTEQRGIEGIKDINCPLDCTGPSHFDGSAHTGAGVFGPLKSIHGPVFNPDGINLEVVLEPADFLTDCNRELMKLVPVGEQECIPLLTTINSSRTDIGVKRSCNAHISENTGQRKTVDMEGGGEPPYATDREKFLVPKISNSSSGVGKNPRKR
ncbi:hypothetical protein Dimus_015361, partial [Dionaea muscipula]